MASPPSFCKRWKRHVPTCGVFYMKVHLAIWIHQVSNLQPSEACEAAIKGFCTTRVVGQHFA
eukprot:6482892-Amphidinium_carterae.2